MRGHSLKYKRGESFGGLDFHYPLKRSHGMRKSIFEKKFINREEERRLGHNPWRKN